MRVQRDVADHDHLVVVGALDDGDELRRVLPDPREDLAIHPRDARGRLARGRLGRGPRRSPRGSGGRPARSSRRRSPVLVHRGSMLPVTGGTSPSRTSARPVDAGELAGAREVAHLALAVDPHARQPELGARLRRRGTATPPRARGARGRRRVCRRTSPSDRTPACTNRSRTPRRGDRPARRSRRATRPGSRGRCSTGSPSFHPRDRSSVREAGTSGNGGHDGQRHPERVLRPAGMREAFVVRQPREVSAITSGTGCRDRPAPRARSGGIEQRARPASASGHRSASVPRIPPSQSMRVP